eukprot:839986-Prymnesium_polylepis.1
MHDPGSIGPSFVTWRHANGCRFLMVMRRAQSGKRSKTRTSPMRTTGGGGGPRRPGLPAPPHHPASCWRVCPPTNAASRNARPAKFQPIAPLVPARRAHEEGGPHERAGDNLIPGSA